MTVTTPDTLYAWPHMPRLRPPHLTEVWAVPAAEWKLDDHWLGPLIDGEATLALRGFGFDGASIPQAWWTVMGHPFQLPMLAYALAHDADYAAELRRRAVCDARMHKGMTLDRHIPAAKVAAVYAAVREFGGGAWARHTPSSVANARRFCRSVGEEEYFALCSALRLPPHLLNP